MIAQASSLAEHLGRGNTVRPALDRVLRWCFRGWSSGHWRMRILANQYRAPVARVSTARRARGYCSSLKPVALITFAQRSFSAASQRPISAGLLPIGSAPWPDSFSLMSDVWMMRAISACSRETSSGGVFPGASTPCQEPVTKPSRPGVSATVGVSGSVGKRLSLDTAIRRSRPLLVWGRVASMPLNRISASPVVTIRMFAAPPLVGI